jgi:lipopolysaccharide transport system ATP-binding protein
VFHRGAIPACRGLAVAARFDDIVAFAGVERFIDTPVKRYSSGMYVRLAFAVAAHLEPEILIVDEVLAVGDVEFQKKCLGKMREVAEGGGRTVLFVSHNMTAVRKLCTHGLYLKHGNVETAGSILSTLKSYLSETEETSRLAEVTFDNDNPQSSLLIKHASVFNHAGEIVSRVQSGDRFGISVCTHALSWQDQCEIQMNIVDSRGDIVTTLDTSLSGHYYKVPAGNTVWTCHLNHLYLSEGQYFISIAAKNRFQNCDVKEACLSFIVEGCCVELGVRHQGRHIGTLVPPRNWNVASESLNLIDEN